MQIRKAIEIFLEDLASVSGWILFTKSYNIGSSTVSREERHAKDWSICRVIYDTSDHKVCVIKNFCGVFLICIFDLEWHAILVVMDSVWLEHKFLIFFKAHNSGRGRNIREFLTRKRVLTIRAIGSPRRVC